MPEGDTIFRTARTLQRALAGRLITRFDTQLAELAVIDRRSPMAGRTIVGAALGPDMLATDLDIAEARRRIRETPARHIAEAILRQQSVAGLGNVFKSELLFLCRIDPFTAVQDVTDVALDALLERAPQLMHLNVQEQGIAISASVGRMTTGRLNPRENLWVYGRAGRPCWRCGTPIRSETETEGRRTYWCPTCQPKASVRAGSPEEFSD